MKTFKRLREVIEMSETINFEKALLEKLRQLPTEKQEEVLDFAQFLLQKAEHKKQLPSESSESNISSTTQPPLKLSQAINC